MAHFISLADISAQELWKLLELSQEIKKRSHSFRGELTGKTLGVVLQKPSTRTAISFAVGMVQLGGFPLILNAEDLQLRRGETPGDTGRVLSQYLDAVVIRANRHQDVLELAKDSSIPVINGLTDKEHPCQVLADLLTLIELRRMSSPIHLKKFTLTYLGDGNNVTHSWMLAAALLGMRLILSCPSGYEPEKEYTRKAQALSQATGASILFEPDPSQAVRETDGLYTDVWASMGKEEERERRREIFAPYQVGEKLLAQAKPDAVVMHCLPARRGEEITDEVLKGPQSVVFQQAGNRLPTQKALLLYLLKGNGVLEFTKSST